MFAKVVGGRQQRVGDFPPPLLPSRQEKGEHLVHVSMQELREGFIRGVALDRQYQFAELIREPSPPPTQCAQRQLAGGEPIANCQTAAQQRSHRAWEAHGAARRCLDQFAAPFRQVREALLMHGMREQVVRSPTVVDQPPGVVQPDQAGQRFVAATTLDLHHGLRLAHCHVQPRRTAANPPARFVGHDQRRAADFPVNLGDGGLGNVRGSQHRAATRRAADRESEHTREQFFDFAVRESQPFVEPGDQGVRLAAQLDLCRAECARGLQRMPALHALSAAIALAHVHDELALDDLRDDFCLKLLGRVRLGHARPVAVRTSLRQLGLQRLVDLLGLVAAELRAIVVAKLAARPLRFGFGGPFRERPRLPLARAAEFFDDATKFGHFFTQRTAAQALR